ncbi:MAG: glycosyltransferase, partial [Actinomycetota bacterium]|nr:glycosyltransferase [Actinomycetota bacterium]
MRGERKALAGAARRREDQLRRQLTEVERRLHQTPGYRAKTAWGMLGRRLSQAGRTASQLGSWVIRPSRTRGLASVREFWALRHSPLFDREYYLSRNHDVVNAGMNPVLHYIEHGARAGLDPSREFSTRRYLEERPDVKASGLNPLYHFVRFGEREGARPRAVQPAAPPRKASAGAAPVKAPGKGPKSVSVVVPTFNRSEGVHAAVASALGQSEPPLEVIVSDDGSTDGTADALRAAFPAEVEAGTLRIERSDERRGASAARNAGLALAQGDLVAYLDSDNTWDGDFLHHLTSALEESDEAATAYAGINFDDGTGSPPRLRFEEYDRELLLTRNFIDLNAFVHERRIFDQLGGFDESLRRLIDWDLILRYTRLYPPATVPLGLVEYHGGPDPARITTAEDFESNADQVRRKLAYERVYSGRTPLRIAYVLWDYPSLSQTFVLEEIRRLTADGHDVNVYFHTEPDRAADVDFDVPTFPVASADELAGRVREHDRTLIHSHFAYPAATRLAWPAARAAGIPFTFTVHAVDVFHSKNIERNRIAEVAADPLCARIFAIGAFHRDFLIERGVPAEKISIVRPAASLRFASGAAVERRLGRERRVVAAIARFVPKKGLADLIRASAWLGSDVEVRLYGYGPEEEPLRALAAELGAARVSFMGPLEDREAVAGALVEADVFALPCTRDEDGDMDG